MYVLNFDDIARETHQSIDTVRTTALALDLPRVERDGHTWLDAAVADRLVELLS